MRGLSEVENIQNQCHKHNHNHSVGLEVMIESDGKPSQAKRAFHRTLSYNYIMQGWPEA